MALVVAIIYAINRGFVKTRFSETIFIDASALFVSVDIFQVESKISKSKRKQNSIYRKIFPS